MTILLKNKETLICEGFIFRCSIGKYGTTKNKLEGDKKLLLEFLILETFITEVIGINYQKQN